MSNKMCSIENGNNQHSMPSTITSSLTSPSLSKSYTGHHHLFPGLGLPLPDTAFPFPPPPIFLSSLLPQPWFPPPPPPPLQTPLSLTAKDVKEGGSKVDSTSTQRKRLNCSSPERDSGVSSSELHQNSSPENSMNEPDNSNNSTSSTTHQSSRQHSADNLSWLADVAISSRSVNHTTTSSPLHHQSSPVTVDHSPLAVHRSNGIFNHTSLPTDSQRLYSSRYPANNMFHFQTSPTLPHPTTPHLTSPFLSSYNSFHQQYNSPSAHNPISPFVVPNSASAPTTRTIQYQNAISDSYHHLLNSVSGSAISSHLASNSNNNNNSRSPSLHSSDSPTQATSGPFSSPTITAGSPDQTKSLVRSSKEQPSPNSQTENARSELVQSSVSCGTKRKSLSYEMNNNNIYKVPTGKEGSLKHRILKPPNINIIESDSDANIEAAPFSAPPIPGVRRSDYLRRISYAPYLGSQRDSQSLLVPAPIQNNSTLVQPRRKSMPQPLTNGSDLMSNDKDFSRNNSSKTGLQNENVLSKPVNHLQYPIYFKKGSIIMLANGKVKPVEEMSTEDFIQSATLSPDLCADSSVVIKIEENFKSRSVLLSFSVGKGKFQVNVEAPLEHPFFVFNLGWSSCSPELSIQRYGLKCRKLLQGDLIVSLTPKFQSLKMNAKKNEDETRKSESSNKSSKTDNEKQIKTNDKRFDFSDVGKKVNYEEVPTSTSPLVKRIRRHSAPDSSS